MSKEKWQPIDKKLKQMIATDSILEEIAALADAVAEDNGGQSVTDLTSLIGEEGITLSYNDYGPHFDGMLEYARGRFHIFCNLYYSKTPTSGRARFTLGHELGHYFIDSHRNALTSGRMAAHGSMADFQSKNAIERQADLFASVLLLPTARLKSLQQRAAFSLAGIEALAEKFQTSLSSTAIRYANVSSRSCAVVRWTQEGVSWMAVSPSMQEQGVRWASITRGTLPRDSATGVVLSGRSIRIEKRGTVATTWFSKRGPMVWNDTVLIEEAISLGGYGALTFIYPDM